MIMRAVIYRLSGGPGVLEHSRHRRLTPRIATTLDLADAAEAHRPVPSVQAVGQIILTPRRRELIT
jgi:hypothetical protein